MTTFREALADARHSGTPILLDGASGTWLEAHGADLSDSLWSAALLGSDPGLVSTMHEAYLSAGAQVIESVGYQATLPGFMQRGYSRARARELLLESWNLAAAAASASGRWAAASLGPYGAYLANGSEYRGDDTRTVAQLADFHAERVALLYSAGARLFAAETVPSAREAEALHAVFRDFPDAEWWLSFSLRSPGAISDGTPLADALQAAPDAVGIGVNCCPAAWVGPALEVITAAGRHALAYPNSGETYASGSGWSGDPDSQGVASYAVQWRKAGAAMIGGCCRTAPGDIAAVARALDVSRAP